jgi:hypothetical protein
MVSTDRIAARGLRAIAQILSDVKSARRPSVLITKSISLAINARWYFALVAESRSLVTMNASIRFAASSARKGMLVVGRKAKRSVPKHPKYAPVTGETRSFWQLDFDLQVVASTNIGRAHRVRSALHSRTTPTVPLHSYSRTVLTT